jgi:hypothetical protein
MECNQNEFHIEVTKLSDSLKYGDTYKAMHKGLYLVPCSQHEIAVYSNIFAN